MKEEERQNKLDVILKRSDLLGDAFQIYAEKISTRPENTPDVMASEKLKTEFFVKLQWFQYYVKQLDNKLSDDQIDKIAATAINSDKAANFSKETSEDLFDGFMHFLVANERRPEVLESFINKWVAGGRDLDELDASEITPAEVAVMTNNDISFVELYKQGLDINAVAANGYTLLHLLVIKIAIGEGEVSFLEKWIEAGLPTDMLSGTKAGEHSGKTPLEFARILGREDLVNMLDLNKDIAIKEGDIAVVEELKDLLDKFNKYLANPTDDYLPVSIDNIQSTLEMITNKEQVIELAETLGLVELTKILGGNDAEAAKNSEKCILVAKEKLIAVYDQVMKNHPVIEGDKTKMLLHYFVANADKISPKIFEKLFSDPMYFESEINSQDGEKPLERAARVVIGYEGEGDILYTPLRYAVHKGYNEFAIIMAKKGGFGVSKTDNNLNILNYCVLENNIDLVKMLIADDGIDVKNLVVPERVLDGSSLPYTPLLQAVVENNIEIAVELAKAGVGTTTLDNTNHILNYVVNFSGENTLEMLKALAAAKIGVSDEKAEQALVNVLNCPEINYNLVKAFIEMGVKTEGVKKLFAENNMNEQVSVIEQFVAEIEEASCEVEAFEVCKDFIVSNMGEVVLSSSTDSLEVVSVDLFGDTTEA